jgi:putative transposase
MGATRNEIPRIREIIRLVEQSALQVRRTLEKLGTPRATFYRWYDRYRDLGPEALDDRTPRPDRVWNRIPDEVRERIIGLASETDRLAFDCPCPARHVAAKFVPR